MIRRVLLAAVALAVILIAVFFGLLWWPLPERATSLRCGAPDPPGCRVVRGRVVYALSKDRRDHSRPLHLVLVSRDSLSAPGVSVVKIPPSLRPESNPKVGSWVAATGVPHRGSNGQTNITASRLMH